MAARPVLLLIERGVSYTSDCPRMGRKWGSWFCTGQGGWQPRHACSGTRPAPRRGCTRRSPACDVNASGERAPARCRRRRRALPRSRRRSSTACPIPTWQPRETVRSSRLTDGWLGQYSGHRGYTITRGQHRRCSRHGHRLDLAFIPVLSGAAPHHGGHGGAGCAA